MPSALSKGSPRLSAPSLIPALTGVRGVAAVWVVAFHFTANIEEAFGVALNLPLIRDGYLGVDIFFILSGFILSHVYYDAFPRYTLREHKHFLLIRLSRIYPLHGFALLLLGLLTLALSGFVQQFDPSFFSFPGFILSLLLLQNWARNPIIWNGPAWSLSAEWMAYVAFPGLLLLVRFIRRSEHALLGAASFLSLLACLFVYQTRSLNLPGTKAGFLRLACEFSAGCLLCHAYRIGLPKVPWGVGNGIALVSLAGVLLWPAATPLAVLPFGYLILSLAQYPGFLNHLLSSRPAVFLGDISYSLYLMHWILLQVANWGTLRFIGGPGSLGQKTVSILVVPAIFGVAIVTWKFVERPARSIGRRFAGTAA